MSWWMIVLLCAYCVVAGGVYAVGVLFERHPVDAAAGALTWPVWMPIMAVIAVTDSIRYPTTKYNPKDYE